MTPEQMEARLVELSERYRKGGRDPAVQAEYRALHARWMAAKGNARGGSTS